MALQAGGSRIPTKKADFEELFEALKALGGRIRVPVFDAEEVVRQINGYMGKLDGRAEEALACSEKQEDLTLHVTNLVDPKKNSLTVHIRAFPEADGICRIEAG